MSLTRSAGSSSSSRDSFLAAQNDDIALAEGFGNIVRIADPLQLFRHEGEKGTLKRYGEKADTEYNVENMVFRPGPGDKSHLVYRHAKGPAEAAGRSEGLRIT